MKRFAAVVMVVSGIVLILLGLLFVIGAGGQVRRLVVAGAALALGAVAAGFGVRTFKDADLESPEQLRAEILDLARRRNGEVSASEIAAELGRRGARGLLEIDAMVGEGACRRATGDGSVYYLFPDMQPRLMARYCEYCDAEFPISEAAADCPNCGGTLETRVATRSLSEGEAFAMDDAPDA